MYDDDDDASWNGGSGVEKSRPEVFGGLEDHHINLNPPPPHGGSSRREKRKRFQMQRDTIRV